MLRQKSMTALHSLGQQPSHIDPNTKHGFAEGGLVRQHSASCLLAPLTSIKRSNSHNALFKELVLQVPINANIPSSERECSRSTLSDSTTPQSVEHEVEVFDALLEYPITLSINASSTMKDLKLQIQAAQGQAGLRIIPSHVQVLTVSGQSSWEDDKLVVDALKIDAGASCSTPTIVVEPLVTEMISFFLASVNNLNVSGMSSPSGTASSLSPEVSPSLHSGVRSKRDDAEWDTDFFLGGMEGHEVSRGDSISPPRAPSGGSDASPPLHMSTSPVESLTSLSLSQPVGVPRSRRGVSWLGDGHELVPLDVESSDAALSARVTPSGPGSDLCHSYGTSYEGASVLAALYAQRDGTGPAGQRAERRGKLDATLLRSVGDAGDAYATQSHLVMRNPALCLPLLQRLKLGALERLVLEVQSGLRHGHSPVELPDPAPAPAKMHYGELLGGCCGGTYLMRNARGKATAIFKPVDEEPYGPANPKGFTGSMDAASDMRPGIPVGGGAARECAAFLLDHEGLAGVPSTAMLRISHSTLQPRADAEVELKVGSLQRFCEHECTVEDVGTSGFPVEAVHAIGMLDVRVFNMDRNSDNILFAPGPRLVPIDHGYILPALEHLEEVEACWLHWPQAKQPFTAGELAYIAELSAEADMALLRSTLAVPERSLLTLFLGTTLLQKGAAAGLTLHDIASVMTRADPAERSAVEEVVAECVAAEQGGAELRAMLEERVGCLVQRRKVGHCFERLGQSMHRRNNSQSTLLASGSESSDEA